MPKLNPEGNRIIPACAGFTAGVPGSGRGRPDHPRMRGVYPGYTPGRDVYHGSSPHTRGLRQIALEFPVREGIIPAHAGFTPGRPGGPGTSRDHPRTRGVYAQGDYANAIAGGSSPHTRGLPGGPARPDGHLRIIPAHAGFTSVMVMVAIWTPDHPRTRGVYPRGLIRGHKKRGIIPAHAGFTGDHGRPLPLCRDHPRTRGVYAEYADYAIANTGSSPHTRGLLR